MIEIKRTKISRLGCLAVGLVGLISLTLIFSPKVFAADQINIQTGNIEIAQDPCLGDKPIDQARCSVSATGGETTEESKARVDSVLKTVINILAWVAGISAVIVIIIQGLIMIISGPGDGKSSHARLKSILYVGIGLVIVISATSITNYFIGVADTPSSTPADDSSNQTPPATSTESSPEEASQGGDS